MGYVIWVLVHHAVWVSLGIALDRGLTQARQRRTIGTSGMFFNVNNGESCALALRAPVRSAPRQSVTGTRGYMNVTIRGLS